MHVLHLVFDPIVVQIQEVDRWTFYTLCLTRSSMVQTHEPWISKSLIHYDQTLLGSQNLLYNARHAVNKYGCLVNTGSDCFTSP